MKLIELSEQRNTGLCIDEIWSIDAANTGDSALVNRGKLGDTCGFSTLYPLYHRIAFVNQHLPLLSIVECLDHVRDILNIIENYLPHGTYDPMVPAPPTHLARVPPFVSESRVQNGLRDRHIVGLGHSFGACSLYVHFYTLRAPSYSHIATQI